MVDLKNVTAKIKNITVYKGGAFITRTIKLDLNKGKNNISIEKLSSSINRDSIQVGVPDDVTCQQVAYISNYNISRVDPESDFGGSDLDNEINRIENLISIVKTKLSMIKNVDVKYDVREDIENFKSYQQYSFDQVQEFILEQSKLENELLQLHIRKEEEKANQKESVWKKLPAVLNIELLAQEKGEYEIEIQYFDKAADWKSHYDIRLNEEKGGIDFILKGNISQNTGEDWNDVNISVSTGKYSQRKYNGTLLPWRIDKPESCTYVNKIEDEGEYYDDDECDAIEDMSYITNNSLLKLDMAPSFMQRPKMSKPKFDSNNSNSEVIDNQNSIIYKLPETSTVLSGKGSDTLFINKHTVDCKIELYTTPKLDCTAFMIAKIENASKYNFIACSANVFFGNRFVGQTIIDTNYEDNALCISLGPDYKVGVKRVVEKKFTSKTLISGNVIEEHLYSIKIENQRNSAIHINVADQIPVSDNAKITVDKLTLSKGELTEVTGKVNWELDIPANKMHELKLGFNIVTKK